MFRSYRLASRGRDSSGGFFVGVPRFFRPFTRDLKNMWHLWQLVQH
nr:MAG TPA: hypothetical protein [Caudoviricetes sp.]